MVDLIAYRQSERELSRTNDLLNLMPASGRIALDVGARDGFLSTLLADRYDTVVALDLAKLEINDPRIALVQGDVGKLAFTTGAFDLVVCCEVLEHVPSHLLQRACDEIVRVAGRSVVIGVPYKQDIRLGRTTCGNCGKQNPPWGHVNSFDEHRLRGLFASLAVLKLSYVGVTNDVTSVAAAALMEFAGNPYGTYSQEEGCIYCGRRLSRPARRTLPQKLATKAGLLLNRFQRAVTPLHANWIHVHFAK